MAPGSVAGRRDRAVRAAVAARLIDEDSPLVAFLDLTGLAETAGLYEIDAAGEVAFTLLRRAETVADIVATTLGEPVFLTAARG